MAHELQPELDCITYVLSYESYDCEDLRFCGILDLSFDSGSTGVSPIYRPGGTRWCRLVRAVVEKLQLHVQ